MRNRATSEAGFTLVEMLIAMFIFSIISVGSMTALTSSLQAKEQMNDRLDDIAEIEMSRALMKADFAHITLRPTRDTYGNRDLYMLSGGVNELIAFTRTGRSNPGGLEHRGDLQRVSYVFENGELIRRSLAQSNPVPLTPMVERVLFDGLSDVDIDFVTGRDSRSILQIPNEGPRPNLDIITLTARFENGDELVQHFEVKL